MSDATIEKLIDAALVLPINIVGCLLLYRVARWLGKGFVRAFDLD